MTTTDLAYHLKCVLKLDYGEALLLAKAIVSRSKRKPKADFFTAMRVYKNRFEMLSNFMYDDIGEFDDIFFKKMNRWHIGEVHAFKDLLKTYLAKAYMLGMAVEKKIEKNNENNGGKKDGLQN